MKRRLTELEWSKVEKLQEESFHGKGKELSILEMKLCVRANREDPERYKRHEELIRENYRKSFLF